MVTGFAVSEAAEADFTLSFGKKGAIKAQPKSAVHSKINNNKAYFFVR